MAWATKFPANNYNLQRQKHEIFTTETKKAFVSPKNNLEYGRHGLADSSGQQYFVLFSF